jgi:hypothetical protein
MTKQILESRAICMNSAWFRRTRTRRADTLSGAMYRKYRATPRYRAASSKQLIQTLRVIGISSLASPLRAASSSRPARAAALPPERGATSTAATPTTTARTTSQLGIDKSHCLLAVDAHVLLVMICVVASAAIRVLRVAVRLDPRRIRTHEARGPSVKLDTSILV